MAVAITMQGVSVPWPGELVRRRPNFNREVNAFVTKLAKERREW